MKDLSTCDLNIRFYANIHSQGQVPRSGMVNPGRKDMNFDVFNIFSENMGLAADLNVLVGSDSSSRLVAFILS